MHAPARKRGRSCPFSLSERGATSQPLSDWFGCFIDQPHAFPLGLPGALCIDVVRRGHLGDVLGHTIALPAGLDLPLADDVATQVHGNGHAVCTLDS
jgi:hypothetical protein